MMGTPFEDIYKIFISQITDQTIFNILQEKNGKELLENNFMRWLISSLGYFSNCRQDLYDLDEELEQFNITLTMAEKQIVAKCMVLSYLSPQIIDQQLMKQQFGSKDYRQHSTNQGLLKALLEVEEGVKKDLQISMKTYSWNLQHVKKVLK